MIPALLQKGVQAGGVLGVGLVAPIVLAVHKYQVHGCRLRPVLRSWPAALVLRATPPRQLEVDASLSFSPER